MKRGQSSQSHGIHGKCAHSLQNSRLCTSQRLLLAVIKTHTLPGQRVLPQSHASGHARAAPGNLHLPQSGSAPRPRTGTARPHTATVRTHTPLQPPPAPPVQLTHHYSPTARTHITTAWPSRLSAAGSHTATWKRMQRDLIKRQQPKYPKQQKHGRHLRVVAQSSSH